MKVRFWGWTENKREEEMDLSELRQRVAEGKPLHPESTQPEWIQGVAYRNSAWSQLKFREYRFVFYYVFANRPRSQRHSLCEISRALFLVPS